MDISAILLIGGSPAASDDGSSTEEKVGGVAIAYLDVLGMAIMERVLLRLQDYGISSTTVISNFGTPDGPFKRFSSVKRPEVQRVETDGQQFWQVADDQFEKCRQAGADLVLVLRIGPYVDIDYETLIQHHLDHHCAVTAAVDTDGMRLDQFVLNASARNDAATLFSSRMTRLRKQEEPFRFTGYVNRLRDASDLRRLAVDGLLARNSVHPQGRQVRPGVWVQRPAHIHRKARIVAPAFIGAHARIRDAAVITRGSVVEHHAQVDCGTVVEDSTLLPFTCVGAGLEVAHSVSGFYRLIDLPRRTEVEIKDGKILGMRVLNPILRFAGITSAFFAFKLKDIYRGLFLPSDTISVIPESLEPAPAALESPVMEPQKDRP